MFDNKLRICYVLKFQGGTMIAVLCLALSVYLTEPSSSLVQCQPPAPSQRNNHPVDSCPPIEAKQLVILPKPIRVGGNDNDEEAGGDDDESRGQIRPHSVESQIRGQ
jgi:hypothetical protein